MTTKTGFWLIIAALYFALSVISYSYNHKVDKVYAEAKTSFKEDYGFRTFGVFELIQQYTAAATIANFIGGLLAFAAAILSAYS